MKFLPQRVSEANVMKNDNFLVKSYQNEKI